MNKRWIRKVTLFIFVLLIGAFNGSLSSAATFEEINQGSVFLNQEGRSTCTLTSAAMMMRRAAMLSGNGNWASITESSLKGTAWVSGTGLKWSFSYAGISVRSATLPTGQSNVNILINLLAQHPEGIVLHYKGAPHAVLLTDYTDGTFYCSDPLASRARARIPLSKAYKVTATNATRYWYVSSPDCYLSENVQAEPEKVRVDEPSGYEITINKTLLTTKESLIATLNPYDNNITNYRFIILKNGSVYQIIDNGASRTLSYKITSPGNYQIYAMLTNEGGTFAGSVDNGGLAFEVSDQILTGFNLSTSGDGDGFDAAKGITIWVHPHDGIEVTNYQFTIYKKDSYSSKYTFYKNVDKGTSNRYDFLEPAGDYYMEITLSNRLGSITGSSPLYLRAVSDSVLGVSIEYSAEQKEIFNTGINNTMKLNAVITPSTALNKNVTWESSNPEVVTVDENGNLYSVGYGFSMITVHTADGNFMAELPVKVNGFGITYGDANGDGNIDISDLVMLRKYVNNVAVPTAEQIRILDLDGNGVLDDEDIEFIRHYIQCVDYIFPVETQLNNIAIVKLPDKKEYFIGEEINLEGMELRVQYNDGTMCYVSEGFSCSANTTTSGKKAVVLLYSEEKIGMTVVFTVDVKKYQQHFEGTAKYNKVYGDADFVLDVFLSEGDGEILYQSDNEAVASVTDSGKVQIHSSGSATITVTAAETDLYEESTHQVKITVNKAEQSITGTKLYQKKNNGEEFLLDAMLLSGDGNLSYFSKNEAVATVNNRGKVTVTGVGTCNIVVKANETANYKEIIFNIIIKVTEDASDSDKLPEEQPDGEDTSESDKLPEEQPGGEDMSESDKLPEEQPDGEDTSESDKLPEEQPGGEDMSESDKLPEEQPGGEDTPESDKLPEEQPDGEDTSESDKLPEEQPGGEDTSESDELPEEQPNEDDEDSFAEPDNTSDSDEIFENNSLKKQKIIAIWTKSYSAKKLKKKGASFKIVAVTSGNGKLTYSLTKCPAKCKKYISVSKNGKVTLKKGLKKGNYKITISAAKTAKYRAGKKVITIKIK